MSGTSYRHEKLQFIGEVSVWFVVVRHFHTLQAQSVNNVSSWLGPILFTDTIICFGSFQQVIKCVLFVLFIFFVRFTSESYLLFSMVVISLGGTWWRSWLRHCAISRKVAGSIPHGVTGFFHWHNPSRRTMALGSTQPLTELSTRNNSWGGKGGWCIGLTTLPPSCANCLEIWEPQPPGTVWACPGL